MFVFSTSSTNQDGTPRPDYLKTKHGILRIAEAVISICGIICYSQTDFCKYIVMYNFVVITTLILSIFIIIASILESTRNFVYSRMIVFINDICFAILYLVVTILSFLSIGGCWEGKGARTAQSIFGVAGTLVVGYLAVLYYEEMKAMKANSSPDAVVVQPNTNPAAIPQNNLAQSPQAPAQPALVINPLPRVNLNFTVPTRF